MDEFEGAEQQGMTEHVEFYPRPVLDEKATAEAGRPIHKEGVYVRISNPGDRTLVIDRPARLTIGDERFWDSAKYPKQWLAFRANQSQDAASGTLLTAWGALSSAILEDYKYFKIVTVEQLAGISDSNLARLGPLARRHRELAQAFLDSSKSNAPLLKLQSELASKDEQFAALMEANRQLMERMQALEAKSNPPEEPMVATPEKKKQGKEARP